MSAQPLNTDIKVYRAVRSYRDGRRNESVAALIKRLRPSLMAVPGQESIVEVKSRDTTVADFSPYMGQARYSATRGFPIVIGLKDQVSLSNAQANTPNTTFAFTVGQDSFLTNTASGLAGDLYQDVRDLSADIDV